MSRFELNDLARIHVEHMQDVPLLDAMGKLSELGKVDQLDAQELLVLLLLRHDREAVLLGNIYETLRRHEQTTLNVMVRKLQRERRKELEILQ